MLTSLSLGRHVDVIWKPAFQFFLFYSLSLVLNISYFRQSSTPPLSLLLFSQIYVDDVLVFRGSLLRSPTIADIQSLSNNPEDNNNHHIGFDENQLPWGNMDCLDLSQSILFTNDDSIVQREVFRLLLQFCLTSLPLIYSYRLVQFLRPAHRQYHQFFVFFMLFLHFQENRVPLPENDLCFFDDGQVKQEAASLDLRANLVRPMTASRRSSAWFFMSIFPYLFSTNHSVCPSFIVSRLKFVVNMSPLL